MRHGLLSEAELDRTVERLFEARIRLGLFDPPARVPYNSIPYSANRAPDHLALSLKAAEESIVLLKNDGILPLAAKRYRTVAVVGPNAASLSAIEGNYNAVPKDPELPVDALRTAFAGAKVIYAQGAPYVDGMALPVPRSMLRPEAGSAEEGLKAEYFGNSGLSGVPAVTRVDHQIDFDWNSASPVSAVPQNDFGVRWRGVIVPLQPGAMEFSVRLSHCYPCGDSERFAMKVDGQTVASFNTAAKEYRESSTPHFHVTFADTTPHRIEIEYTHKAPLFGGGISLEWVPPAGVLQRQAVAAAQSADLVVAMIGLSPELEGEEMPIKVTGFAGGDRTEIGLPASQQEMLEEIAATGKPMIVLLLNGSALAVDWAESHAQAILEAWYPGEFGGKAIAETLLGRNDPTGRLPVTFYASLDQLPPFADYSMRDRTYRYFPGIPLYEFGYGLSYTHFTYSRLRLSTSQLRAGDTLTAEVEVKNTGRIAGGEVAELYLTPPTEGNEGLSPKLQLEGFQHVFLKPGESRKLSFALDPRQLSEVDAKGVRSVQDGHYRLSIGGSQPQDPRARTPAQNASFTITGSQELPH